MIGGPVAQSKVPSTLLDHENRELAKPDRDELWELLVAIGTTWGNLPYRSAAIRSSWLEFIAAKTEVAPSYVGEYTSAAAVLRELRAIYGAERVYEVLFFEHGIPPGEPTTRLAHLKRFVVDEFIRMQIVASGFKDFVDTARPTDGNANYNGYVGGSRYNLVARVRRASDQPHPERDWEEI